MKKLLLLLVSVPGLFCCANTSEVKEKPSESDPEIVGTKWYNDGYFTFPGDTLFFVNEKKVEYFLGELPWTYDSQYEIKKDTLIVKTVTAAFEVNDITGLEPDLIQKYIISADSLKLVYLANRRNGDFIEADPGRYKKISDFVKIK